MLGAADFWLNGWGAATGPSYRYYRFQPVATRTPASTNDMQMSEFAVLNGTTRLTGMTVTGPGADSPANEGPAGAADNDLSTKWLSNNLTNPGYYLLYDFGAPVAATGYRVGTANDAPERDPISWNVEGSNDAANWTRLDTQRNIAGTTARQVYLPDFAFTSSAPSVSVSATLTGTSTLTAAVAIPLPNPERGFFNYTETHYPPTATSQTDSFTGTNGAAPSANFATSITTGGSATIQSNALRLVTGVQGAYNDATRLIATLGQAADITVTLDATPSTTAEAYFDVMLRAPSNDFALGQAGYKFELTNAGGVSIQKVTGYSGTTLGSGSVTGFAAGVAVHLQASVTGSTLALYAWTGATKPSTPTITATDSTYASGYAGFYLNGGNAASALTWTVDNWTATVASAVSSYTPLVAGDLTAKRAAGMTQVFRYFVLEKYRTQDTIDQAYLDLLAADLAAVRAAGCKLIARFCYSTAGNISAAPYSSDTTATRTLGHIAQLAPVLNQYADVVDTVEAGFIGMWGEWYYTDNFGDLGVTTTQQAADRKSVVDALLTQLDSRIYVLLRYVGSMRQLIDADPTNTGYVNRLGNHNDAFLASSDDFGTYTTFTPYTEAQNKAWLQARQSGTVHFPQGHESAALNSPRSDYASAATDLAAYRFSFLNPNYHPGVLSSWGQANVDTVGSKLGYRLTLNSATIGAPSGGNVSVSLSLTNNGYAAPYRARPVFLDFVSGGTTVSRQLAADVRTWAPGAITVSETVAAPSTAGTYTVHLRIADASASLQANPLYTVALTNGTFDSSTGRNATGQSVTVTTAVTVPVTLTGTATLSATVTSATTSAVSLTGTSTLSAVVTSAVAKTATLTGTSTLSAITQPALAVPAALNGTSTLTAAVSTTETVTAQLVGAGVLSATVSTTLATAVVLTGSATTSATVTPALAVAATATGTSTLAAASTSALTRTVALSGTSSLTAAVALPVAVTLTSTSVLTATVTISVTRPVTLNGASTLTATTSSALSRAAGLSGSSTLSAIVQPHLQLDADFESTSSLAVGDFAVSTGALLTGAGELAAETELAVDVTADLNGAGTLMVDTATALSTAVDLSSAGHLTATVSPALSVAVTIESAGQLAATSTSALSVTAPMTGSSIIEVSVTSAGNVFLTATLTGSSVLTAEVSGISLHTTADLTGQGTLSAVTASHLSTVANLNASASLLAAVSAAGSSTVQLSGTAGLTAVVRTGLTAAVVLTGTGVLTAQTVITLPGAERDITITWGPARVRTLSVDKVAVRTLEAGPGRVLEMAPAAHALSVTVEQVTSSTLTGGPGRTRQLSGTASELSLTATPLKETP